MNEEELGQLDLLSIDELIVQFGSAHYNMQMNICEALRSRGMQHATL